MRKRGCREWLRRGGDLRRSLLLVHLCLQQPFRRGRQGTCDWRWRWRGLVVLARSGGGGDALLLDALLLLQLLYALALTLLFALAHVVCDLWPGDAHARELGAGVSSLVGRVWQREVRVHGREDGRRRGLACM